MNEPTNGPLALPPGPSARPAKPPPRRTTPNAWTTCPGCGAVLADADLHAAAFPDHQPTEGDT